MIDRTVLALIEESISLRPITLITGARQVGKTTICSLIAKKYGIEYVSLANVSERALAISDPEMFLKTHGTPLIIDEVQYAPALFDHIEAAVDKQKFDTGINNGMFILTGSQAYNLMENVTQSMAGRVSIIRMSPLSINEIGSRPDIPFTVDFEKNIKRSLELKLDLDDIYEAVIRGFYPELHEKGPLKTRKFYSDYVESYIERDVSQIINIKDQGKFLEFMQLLASLTGQELVYNNIANTLGLNIRTIQSWVGVLAAGDIIHLLQPYFERSTTKRIVKRPKIYFSDTGLACYLAKVFDTESLKAGYLRGPMVETLIVNEILKSYKNNGEDAGFFYYRDSQMNKIDLIILRNGKISLIECKSGMKFDESDIKAFGRMDKSDYTVGPSCIICLTEKAYPITKNVYALPLTAI
ncbi:MAG: ATP-binding protein [Candidatus Methanoplasma sp.]|jgi:predicted AAA+ superfamily ATPase|nr:ATP-binding protein [Candidatus Methanoplasma sp.]